MSTTVIEKGPVDKSCSCINTNDDDDKDTIYEALSLCSGHYAYYFMYVISLETQGPQRARTYKK